MASLDRSLGGDGADPHPPCAVGAGIPGGSALSGGGEDGGGLGTLGSPWISRLRPTPRPPPSPGALFVPAGAAALAAGGGRAVPIWDPAVDSGSGRGLLRQHPPPPPAFFPRLLCRDAAGAASSSGHVLQRHWRGAEAEQGRGRGVGQEQKEMEMAVGFGPFQVRPSSAPLMLVEGVKQQQEHNEWRLERVKSGGSDRSYRTTAGGSHGIGRGNCGSFVGDGCFPFLQRVAQLGAVRGEVGDVAGRDGRERGLLAEDERWRVSTPPGTGQRDATNGNGWRLQEASLFPQRGTLCMFPNIRVPSDIGSDSVAGPSQILKNNQWFRRHRWGENPKLLDYHSASSVWPVTNGSVARPRVSGSRAGDDASRPRLHDKHIMASPQGTAYRDTTDDTAGARTSYVMPDSNEVVRQQIVIKSSRNIERIERARVMSSFCQSLALDKGVGRKRTADPDAFGPFRSQKPRTRD